MNKIEDIFEYFGMVLIDTIPIKNFEYAILELDRLPNMAGYGAYFVKDGQKTYLQPDEYTINPRVIHDLYDITSKFNEGNNDWNKAYFKLFPNHKFEINFKLLDNWEEETNQDNY